MEQFFYGILLGVFLVLALWQISLLLMAKKGGMRKNYGLIIDYILGLDDRFRVVRQKRLSVVIAFGNRKNILKNPGARISGGGKFDVPFFEILQQYDFLVINCYYLTAGGSSCKKSWTFKDNDDQQFIRDVLKTEIDKIKADKNSEQTRLSWEKKIDEEAISGKSKQGTVSDKSE